MRAVKKIALTLGIILASVTMLEGCAPKWYAVVSRMDGDKPVFCMSRYSHCNGSGVQLGLIYVFEVDSAGEKVRSMWETSSMTTSIIKILEYGVAPKDWDATTPAALEPGKIYTLNSLFYFRFNEKKPIRLVDREQFFENGAD